MRASLESDLQACSEEVQQAYGGQQAVEMIIDNCVASRDSSAPDVTPVVQAIMQALLNSGPATHYPVHGTTGPVDWGIVSWVVIPSCVVTTCRALGRCCSHCKTCYTPVILTTCL